MTLFQYGNFVLKSGMSTSWKIDCDALTESDWATLAFMAAHRLGLFRKGQRWHFDRVFSCGGAADNFARHLVVYGMGNGHCDRGYALIAEDVVTTGDTMKAVADKTGLKRCRGVAVFARGRSVPAWVLPLFYFWDTSRKPKELTDG